MSFHSKYRPDIDGLRALAVSFVVLYHAFPDYIAGGFIGVDIFFVISGYLISQIIYSDLTSNSFSFVEFYGRRVKRIFPALILVLVFCLALGGFVLFSKEYIQLGRHIVTGIIFVSNIQLWSESGYFDSIADLKPLLHLWSLGIEEQFYIFWPVLLLLVFRRKRKFLTITVSIFAISFLINLYSINFSKVAAFYSPLSRVWELMAGGILAYANMARPDLLQRQANIQGFLGFVAIIFGAWVINQEKLFPGGWALLPVIGAFLIISAGPHAWINKIILSNKWMVRVGLISYPLYLWHWPLLSYARIVNGDNPAVPYRIGLVALSIFLAWLTYQFVERPVRRTQGVIHVRYLLLIGVILISVGIVINQAGGLPDRSINRNRYVAITEWPEIYMAVTHCRERYPVTEISHTTYCMLEDRVRNPSIALLGDSVANSFYFGLVDYYRSKNQEVVQIGKAGCPPLLNVESSYLGRRDGCLKVTNDYLQVIAKDPNIKIVILAGNWHLYINGRRFHPHQMEKPYWRLTLGGTPELSNNGDVFLRALEETLEYLKKSGKEVVFLHQPPELNYFISSCIPRFGERESQCKTDRVVIDSYLDEYKKIISPLLEKHTDIIIKDPIDQFCDSKYCYSQINKKFLYRDDIHLSKEGSIYFGEMTPLEKQQIN